VKPLAGPLTKQQKVISSRFSEVPPIQGLIVDAAVERGFDEAQVFAIKLALEEALTNAIKHGNRMDPSKQVTIDYTVTDRAVRITVCDEGGGFSPERVPDPTADVNLEKPTGRGVMLIRAYMTEVHFNRAGNCITMVKRRECELPAVGRP
jgi:serine/threonine-protein kinase RsbW